MEIELLPEFEMQPMTFNVLIAPGDLAVDAVRHMIKTMNVLFLYVCGNYSRILTRVLTVRKEIDVERAFTASQLLDIITKAHQSMIFIEHDPVLFEESDRFVEIIRKTIFEMRGDHTIVLYSPIIDDSLRMISRDADRFFYFEIEKRRGDSFKANYMRNWQELPLKEQTHLEEF